MTTIAFGEVFGVTHTAVLKWENGHLPSTALDLYMRMFIMDRLKANDAEFGQLYHQIPMADLTKAKKRKISPKPLTLRMKEHHLARS